jgi:hypothetical protein
LYTHTINRNDLNALGARFEAKENLDVDTLPFWWIKATIMEGKLPNALTITSPPL